MTTGNQGGGYKPPRQYDENYKRQAVELRLRGERTIGAVARELGVARSMLHEWRRKYASGTGR